MQTFVVKKQSDDVDTKPRRQLDLKTFRLAELAPQHTLLATNLYHNNQPPTIQIHHQSSVKTTPFTYPKPLQSTTPTQIKLNVVKQKQHQTTPTTTPTLQPIPSPIFFYQQ